MLKEGFDERLVKWQIVKGGAEDCQAGMAVNFRGYVPATCLPA